MKGFVCWVEVSRDTPKILNLGLFAELRKAAHL